jgi:hypothetical protein
MALLCTLKYALDAALVAAVADRFWGPLDELLPPIALRVHVLTAGMNQSLLLTLAVLNLPFLYFAALFTARRALDSGRSPFWAFAAIAPVIQVPALLALGLQPTRPELSEPERAQSAAIRLQSGFAGAAVAVGFALAATVLSVYVFRQYGATLFLFVPVLMGATSAFLHNRAHARTVRSTLGVMSLALLAVGLLLIGISIEGAVCVLMAAPIAWATGAIGALLGRMLALNPKGRPRHLVVLLAVTPLLMAFEGMRAGPPVFEVETSVEVSAPIARVWPHVANLELGEAPPPLLFRAGIAYPKQTSLESCQAGALRRAEFSTGTFEERVTRCTPPYRLAFDVERSAKPMTELSPYGELDAPHLHGFFQPLRGELTLIGLGAHRTLVQARTVYSLEIYPIGYWRIWSEGLLHSMHGWWLDGVRTKAELPR